MKLKVLALRELKLKGRANISSMCHVEGSRARRKVRHKKGWCGF